MIMIGCFLFALEAQAFSLSPLRSTVVIDPGKSQTVEIIITNTEDSSIQIVPEVDAFTIDEQTGKAIWGRGDIAKKWIVSQQKTIFLLPGQTKKVSYDIIVPDIVEPGAHYIGLFAKKKSGREQIGASPRIGSLLFLYVSGQVVEDFTKDVFSISGEFFWKPPVKIFFQFTNDGTIHIVPEGKLVLKKGLFHKKIIKEIDVNPKHTKVLPHIRWNKEYSFFDFTWRDIGIYTVQFDLEYGLKKQKIYNEVTFFYISPIISVIFGLLFIIAGYIFFTFYKKHS
jgi:hypothetical protein